MVKQSSQSAFRALLVSTSVIALAGTWEATLSPAQAQGIEVFDTTVTGVAVGAAESTDYILVSNSTVTTDGIANEGEIGDVSPNATGILVTDGSNVSGGITNSGNLVADERGIGIFDSNVAGVITNSGVLHAGETGIDILFTDAPVSISNEGQLQVGSDVAGTHVEEAYGIRFGSTNIDVSISNSDMVTVVASDIATGEFDDAEALAHGIELRAFTELDATVNNNGTLAVTATADDAEDSDAIATGIFIELAPSEAPPPANAISAVTNSSASTIDVSAISEASSPFGDAEANAEAAGILQISESAVTTDFSGTNSGSLLVESLASANANSAAARAYSSGIGILQSADGGSSSLLTATNSSLIQVSSVASAAATSFGFSSATAIAAGIAQDADFVEDMTSTVTNSGDISVAAETTVGDSDAGETAFAEAQGIRQTGNGGESSGLNADLSVAQTGNIDVSAIVSHEGFSNGAVEATAQGIAQEAEGIDTAALSVVNGGNIAVSASADGAFSSSFSFHGAISAEATGISQESFTFLSGPSGSQTVSSSGTIAAMASAGLDEAIDTDNAQAEAFGIRQMASGYGEIEVTSTVTGDLDATALSQANAAESFAQAQARAAGIAQSGQSFDENIQLTATTDGNTNVTAVAGAESSSGASADAAATGIAQTAFGNTAAGASASNTGTMIVSASAMADGGSGESFATAFGAGILQNRSDGMILGFDEGQLIGLGVTNTSLSTIDVSVVAEAAGAGSGTAMGEGVGISQNITRAGDAPANADNSGGISVSVDAIASNSDDSVTAVASASSQGIFQSVFSSSGNVSGNLTSGVMTVASQANATATGASSDAAANAFSVGLDQNHTAQSAAATSNITTTVSLDVSAIAGAEASSSPSASAAAFGSRQIMGFVDSGAANFTNSGNVSVLASASATGSFSQGFASATGAYIQTSSTDQLTVQANNAGNMTVTANADGDGFESANAAGIHVVAPNLTGVLANNGTMTVHASAPEGAADAYGIRVQSDSFAGTIGNYGTMTVTAEEGIPGTAYGLVIESNGAPSGTSGTVENDGFLSAQVAISTLDAPGPSQINQLGGLILGDIVLSSAYADTVEFTAGTIEGDTYGSGNDDVFNFRSGSGSGAPTVTYIGNIDGMSIVNVHPGMAYLDGEVTGSAAAFNVLSGGYMTLSSNGPTQINVDSYTQVSGGILAYEITPDPTSAAQINASSVSLDGAVTVVPLSGFYPNTITYEEVVVSSGPTGQWATEIDTALLDVEAIYQGDNTVDLMVTRIPFDQVEGLNENEESVGGGLEEIYENSEGTPIGEAIEELFILGPDAYREVLASLSGSEYAQGLQSLLNSQRMFRGSVLGHLGHGNGGGGGSQSASLGQFEFLSSQMAAAASDEGGQSAPAAQRQQVAAAESRDRAAGSVGIWARAYGNFGDNDGDQNAVGFEQEQYGFAAGADVAVAEGLVLGLAGGYSDNELDFDNSNRIDYDGFQVAAYGSFSPGPWYLDGMVSYAWYDHDSRRSTIGGTARGDYDGEVFSAYAETGYAFDLMPVSVTPFLGVGYTHAETDSFTENGAGAFDLRVDSNDAESLTTTLGVELEARLKLTWDTFVVPKLRLGWEHEFEDNYQTVGASLAGAPASG
ncbi:MAG: autotransporter outer membrane beta-barrel domain-containing protein, partial [Rhodovibrionaceae bacterium]